MASYIEQFKSKMNWANTLERTDAFPLDRTSIWASYSDALKYAKADEKHPDARGLYGLSYIGQLLAVFENDKVKVYQITPTRDLEYLATGSDLNDVLQRVSNISEYCQEYYQRLKEKQAESQRMLLEEISLTNDSLWRAKEELTNSISKVKEQLYFVQNETLKEIEDYINSIYNKINEISKADFYGGEFIYNSETKEFE